MGPSRRFLVRYYAARYYAKDVLGEREDGLAVHATDGGSSFRLGGVRDSPWSDGGEVPGAQRVSLPDPKNPPPPPKKGTRNMNMDIRQSLISMFFFVSFG